MKFLSILKKHITNCKLIDKSKNQKFQHSHSVERSRAKFKISKQKQTFWKQNIKEIEKIDIEELYLDLSVLIILRCIKINFVMHNNTF